MKPPWPTKKLGEVAYFQEGPGLRTFQFKPNGIRVINVANIQNGFLDLTETKFLDPDEVKQKYKHFLVNENDILVSTSGTIGRVAWVKKQNLPLMLNTSVVRFHTLNEKILSNKFLFYFLSSSLFKNEILKYKTGVAIFNVGPSHIKRIKIPLPPLNIQQKIVERLDAIKKAQELNDKQIELAEELFQSLLNKELNLEKRKWDIKKLKEVCIEITDGTHHTPKYINKGIPFLSVKNIKEDRLDFTDIQYISEEEHNQLIKRCNPQKGDVLYTKVGTTGIAKAIDVDKKFSIFVSVALLRVDKKKIIPEFLEKVLNSPFCRTQAYLYTQGVANQNLVIRDIERIKIPLPPLETQQKIVEKLSAVQEYKKKLLDQKQKLQELFDSVLNKSFKGELAE